MAVKIGCMIALRQALGTFALSSDLLTRAVKGFAKKSARSCNKEGPLAVHYTDCSLGIALEGIVMHS